jgi:four helix bundle protein
MSFNKEELIKRFKLWSYGCLDIIRGLDRNTENKVISYQLAKSATSSYANYRAACRAKSKADLINKLKIVEEELDESMMWLETLHDRSEVLDCRKEIVESNELLSIVVSSLKTLKNHS